MAIPIYSEEQIKAVLAIRLTPLEEATIEVLTARHHLGEREWSVPAAGAHRRVLRRLSDLELITFRTHNANPKYAYAGLTDLGIAAFIYSNHYTTPLFKRFMDMSKECVKAQVERDEARRERDKLTILAEKLWKSRRRWQTRYKMVMALMVSAAREWKVVDDEAEAEILSLRAQLDTALEQRDDAILRAERAEALATPSLN